MSTNIKLRKGDIVSVRAEVVRDVNYGKDALVDNDTGGVSASIKIGWQDLYAPVANLTLVRQHFADGEIAIYAGGEVTVIATLERHAWIKVDEDDCRSVAVSELSRKEDLGESK